MLANKLLREIRGGSGADYGELYHQACHQFSVGEVAYAVVPHVIEIARKEAMRECVWPLIIAGTVAAARVVYPHSSAPIPDDLREEYLQANDEAVRLAADALRERIWEPGDSLQILAAMAAFQGHMNLAVHLFLSGGSSDPSCPACGESIEFGERG